MSDLPPQLKPHIAVQDAVHGRIWLTELEQAIINTPEFQRLRHISQLGLANFVFPTATHSRFAHSLGATHIMGWVLRQPPLQRYFHDRPEHVVLLRLAALLHDIGHFPFSHLGENVYGAVEYGALGDYDDQSETSVFDVAAQARLHVRASHELITAAIIRDTQIGNLIEREVASIDARSPLDVLIEIIDGSYFDSVCHSLISSDLDCDRLDYLVRDSAAAGLTYGQVDLGYLIENMRVESHSRYGPILAVDLDHGFGAVEHYLHARYFHYARFITHKTIASAELSLAAAMLELIRANRLPANAEAVKALVGKPEYLAFTDHRIWDLLQRARLSRIGSHDLGEAATSLIDRRLMKCAISLERLEPDDLEPQYDALRLVRLVSTPEQKAKVADATGVSAKAFCYKKTALRLAGIPARITPKPGDTEKYEWIQTVNVARPGQEPRPVVMLGLLEHLSMRRWVTRRVFVRETGPEAAGKSAEARPTTSKLRRYFEAELEH